jgi:hypothetical protein
MGTDQHTEMSLRYTVDDSEKKYLHAYQRAYAFFPPVFEDTADDDDSGNGVGVGDDAGDGDGDDDWEGDEDGVGDRDRDGADEHEHNGSGEDSEEPGDVCDNDQYGGLHEFDTEYLKRFSKHELDLIDSNDYDADELDEENAAKYASGMSDDQKRAAELQANLDRIQEHIQMRELLVKVISLSSALIPSCHHMLWLTTVARLTLGCWENSQEVSDAIWPRQYRILQRTEPTTTRVILAEDQSAVVWTSIKVPPDVKHVLNLFDYFFFICRKGGTITAPRQNHPMLSSSCDWQRIKSQRIRRALQ